MRKETYQEWGIPDLQGTQKPNDISIMNCKEASPEMRSGESQMEKEKRYYKVPFCTLANFCSACIKNCFLSVFLIHSTMPGTALDVPKLQISLHLFFPFNLSPKIYVTLIICTGPEIQN